MHAGGGEEAGEGGTYVRAVCTEAARRFFSPAFDESRSKLFDLRDIRETSFLSLLLLLQVLIRQTVVKEKGDVKVADLPIKATINIDREFSRAAFFRLYLAYRVPPRCGSASRKFFQINYLVSRIYRDFSF